MTFSSPETLQLMPLVKVIDIYSVAGAGRVPSARLGLDSNPRMMFFFPSACYTNAGTCEINIVSLCISSIVRVLGYRKAGTKMDLDDVSAARKVLA